MNQREKTLAGLAGLLVLAGLGWIVYGWIQEGFQERASAIESLEDQLRTKEVALYRAKAAASQLADLTEHSLPADLNKAEELYQKWLVELVAATKLDEAKMQPGRATPQTYVRNRKQRIVYVKFPYTLTAQGSMDQIVQFLQGFYKLDHLHLIHRMALVPIEKEKGKLDLTLSIEALFLPGADPADSLRTEPAPRLASLDLAALKTAVVKRNLFAEYTPPPPPPVRIEPRPPQPVVRVEVPRPPSFDPAKFAVITAMVHDEDGAELSIISRTDGKTHTVREGDSVQIGQFKGRVHQIGLQEAVLEENGQYRILRIGDALHQTPPPEPKGGY